MIFSSKKKTVFIRFFKFQIRTIIKMSDKYHNLFLSDEVEPSLLCPEINLCRSVMLNVNPVAFKSSVWQRCGVLAHKRLSEPPNKIEWLLAKPSSLSDLPAFPGPYGGRIYKYNISYMNIKVFFTARIFLIQLIEYKWKKFWNNIFLQFFMIWKI